MARFADANNLYRYSLICNDTLCLKRSELISSVHKLIRRAHTKELMFLIDCFFKAVQLHIDVVCDVSTTLKASVSNFINRFTLSLLEEGVIIHCPSSIQDEITSLLTEVSFDHANHKYADVSSKLKTVIRTVHPFYRGRLGSVVMSYAAHDRPLPTDDNERQLVQALYPTIVNTNATPSKFVNCVQDKLPHIYPLTLLSPYKDCGEFRRVCVMNAPCALFIPDELKVKMTDDVDEVMVAPTRDLLKEIGALDDVHTKGKHDRNAWKEFLNKGMKVAHETPLVLFGHTYTELEQLYSEGKESELDDGVFDVKKSAKSAKMAKRDNDHEESGDEFPALLKTSGIIDPVVAEYCFESPDSFLELTDHSQLLGFKNGTVIAKLSESIGEFHAGEEVFFKMGETQEDCAFTLQVTGWQKELEIPFVPTMLVWVKPSLEWWEKVPSPLDTKGNWKESLFKCLRRRSKTNISNMGYMPCLLAKRYKGVRLTVAHGSFGTSMYGHTLLKTLLFAKHVGVKDVGPFNMLVSPNHQVLLVDIGKPSNEHMIAYDKKGLFTSHVFTDQQTLSMQVGINRKEIVDFISKLQRVAPRASMDAVFWEKVDHYCRGEDVKLF
jgi:hypothetical protein